MLLVLALLAIPSLRVSRALPALSSLGEVSAQHAAFRVKGRVVTDRGEPIPNADVRLEAFFGYAAGTFAGPRTLSTRTNAKGEWNVGGLQPGIWLFEAIAPDYLPETVVLPTRRGAGARHVPAGARARPLVVPRSPGDRVGLLLQRDFDGASRAFDATRNRTHDTDEQKFLSAAIGDLATIKVR